MGVLEPVTLVAPINNSTLYCKDARILFNLNDGNGLIIIYVTVSNNTGVFNYTSTRNPELFSAIAFKPFDKVSFVSQDICEGENVVSIRTYGDESFSSEKTFMFNYKESLLAVNEDTEAITAPKFKSLLLMTNDTLKAYNRTPIDMDNPSSNESKIYKNYFSFINNSLYDLNNWININYPGLNRIRTKSLIGINAISKKIYNNLLNFIIHL
jgi:hypothetical protein